MDIMSNYSGMGHVDWNHSFLYGGIKHDLSSFRIAKDVELCVSARVSTKVGPD